MPTLETRIPPPLVAISIALMMWLTAPEYPVSGSGDLMLLVGSISALTLGSCFSLAGIRSFRRAHTSINPLKPEEASVLVNSGVYRLSRNPMYVGLALCVIAWAIFLASATAFWGVVVFIIYIDHFQIRPEEKALKKLFGDEFIRYMSQVPRWL